MIYVIMDSIILCCGFTAPGRERNASGPAPRGPYGANDGSNGALAEPLVVALTNDDQQLSDPVGRALVDEVADGKPRSNIAGFIVG